MTPAPQKKKKLYEPIPAVTSLWNSKFHGLLFKLIASKKKKKTTTTTTTCFSTYTAHFFYKFKWDLKQCLKGSLWVLEGNSLGKWIIIIAFVVLWDFKCLLEKETKQKTTETTKVLCFSNFSRNKTIRLLSTRSNHTTIIIWSLDLY